MMFGIVSVTVMIKNFFRKKFLIITVTLTIPNIINYKTYKKHFLYSESKSSKTLIFQLFIQYSYMYSATGKNRIFVFGRIVKITIRYRSTKN